MYYCHCSDCRKVNGTAFHTGLYLDRAGFNLSGDLASYALTADSGRTIYRYSCTTCAGQIYSDKDADTQLVSIKAGTLYLPEQFEPDTEIWAQSKVKWAQLSGNLDTHQKGFGDKPFKRQTCLLALV